MLTCHIKLSCQIVKVDFINKLHNTKKHVCVHACIVYVCCVCVCVYVYVYVYVCVYVGVCLCVCLVLAPVKFIILLAI